MNVDLLLQLEKFNTYEFVEDTHTYYYNGCPVDISVTSFIQRYYPKFQFDIISEKYANKHGLDIDAVRQDWKLKGLIASTSGTIIHSHLENLKRGKRFAPDYSKAEELNILDEVKDRVSILLPKADNFHVRTKNYLIPVKLEYTVGINTKLAGNIDLLCWNTYDNEFQIWDYKNVKAIEFQNNFQKCYEPFQHLDDCSYAHYSLQLNFYKAMIERQLNLKIGKMYLVSFSYLDNSDQFNIYECMDLQNTCRKELDILDGK